MELESQGKEQMEHVLFTEIVFLDDLVKQLDTRRAECSRDINSLARSIFQLLLRNHGKNEDFMYFAEKLNMSELILVGRNQELGQR